MVRPLSQLLPLPELPPKLPRPLLPELPPRPPKLPRPDELPDEEAADVVAGALEEVASDEPLLEDEPPLEVPLPPWVLEMMNLAPSSVSPLLITIRQQKTYV